jgi:hypothetical protein
MMIADTEHDVVRKEIESYTYRITNIIANGATLGIDAAILANCLILQERELISSIVNRYRDKMIKNSVPCSN